MNPAFKVDESLPNEAAVQLKHFGYDALTVFDQGLNGRSDAEVADICRRERRVLVTFDRDFGNILNYPPVEYAGIMVLSPSRNDKPSVLSLLDRAITELKSEPIDGNYGSLKTIRFAFGSCVTSFRRSLAG